ncbi:hypothetical protein GCM10009021_19420 [Halarchaeum nitratireducens]|uniref:Uncharacterized protein n=1 Tax=Halarchaeum nitratireducens TaxID=489913 RepID=A0A830GC42_9EURY|nr:hypothetical protein GCM10009021_19420 [Halarchaeum nitratireducens]
MYVSPFGSWIVVSTGYANDIGRGFAPSWDRFSGRCVCGVEWGCVGVSDDRQERRERTAEALDAAADAIEALHLGDVGHGDDGDLRGLRDGLRSWACDLQGGVIGDE